ncbi:Serine/threonine-protein phosphatase [Mycena kentingensis (nom. inval.)]|nr:Serine/threonine-protein phosphatase [Mycena kentingensis (nom. inval.)]
MPHLPLELCELVIDSASSCGDVRTLCRCSLVCKSWFPRARYHLFATLDLSADWTPEANRVSEFIALLPVPPSSSASLYDNDSPNLWPATLTCAPFISTVVLAKRSWGITSVARVLARLEAAGVAPRAVVVDCPAYEPPRLCATRTPFAACLRHLELRLHIDVPFAQLVGYVKAFERLESLCVGGSARYSVDSNAELEVEAGLPASLHALSFAGPNAATPFLHWLGATSAISASSGFGCDLDLRSLVLHDICTPSAWTAVLIYLSSWAARSLELLELHNCDSDAAPRELLSSFSIASLESIDELIITHKNPAAAFDGLISLLRVPPMDLSPGPESRSELHAITLGFGNAAHTNSERRMTELRSRWAMLDGMLRDGKRFAGLKRIDVGIWTPPASKGMHSGRRTRMMSALPEGYLYPGGLLDRVMSMDA